MEGRYVSSDMDPVRDTLTAPLSVALNRRCGWEKIHSLAGSFVDFDEMMSDSKILRVNVLAYDS